MSLLIFFAGAIKRVVPVALPSSGGGGYFTHTEDFRGYGHKEHLMAEREKRELRKRIMREDEELLEILSMVLQAGIL